MRPASEKSAIGPDVADESLMPDSVSTQDSAEAEGFLSASELMQLRQEKLATIRRSVANGDYDSEELLEKALGRMLESLEQAPDFQAR